MEKTVAEARDAANKSSADADSLRRKLALAEGQTDKNDSQLKDAQDKMRAAVNELEEYKRRVRNLESQGSAKTEQVFKLNCLSIMIISMNQCNLTSRMHRIRLNVLP